MMIESIKQTILKAVPDATIYVQDPNNDGQHFEALVISATFEGMMLVKQHQLVMKALKEKFETSVHALGLKTFTPAKWDTVKDQYLSIISSL